MLVQEWEEVAKPRTFSAEVECLVAKTFGLWEVERSKIFSADNYSFDVVARSVQVVIQRLLGVALIECVARSCADVR